MGKKLMNILEYFTGNPDTIDERDDDTGDLIKSWYYEMSRGFSFGWFQTSIDGKKEFVAEEHTSHYELTRQLAIKLIGNAINDDSITQRTITQVGYAINETSAFKGRTFSDPKVITTWHKVSSSKLSEIIDNLGGIELFKDYTYVYPKEYDNEYALIEDGGSMSVIEYLESNATFLSKYDAHNMEIDLKSSMNIDNKVYDIIKRYNDSYGESSGSWAAQKERSGWKTLAQRNATIYQEGKKQLNTIKDNSNMKISNDYKNEFSNYINIMNEALKRNDFKAYDSVKYMLDEAIDDCKHRDSLLSEMNTNNFGILNHIFEQELPTLIKTNKKAVKEVIKLIKEDKNLLNEFKFYNAIKNQYKGDTVNAIGSNVVLEKLAEIAVKGINQGSVKESNKKLKKLMFENNIVPSDFVDEESRKLYECGHIILTRKKTTSNMIPLMESYHSVCEYMDKHKNDKVNESSRNIDDVINEFEEKLKTNLNESEMSFVQQITDFRTPIAEQRKEKLFNKFKNECVEKIDEMLKEDESNSNLKGLKSQISEMKFNKDTIVTDIAKLLEIRDILMDD